MSRSKRGPAHTSNEPSARNTHRSPTRSPSRSPPATAATDAAEIGVWMTVTSSYSPRLVATVTTSVSPASPTITRSWRLSRSTSVSIQDEAASRSTPGTIHRPTEHSCQPVVLDATSITAPFRWGRRAITSGAPLPLPSAMVTWRRRAATIAEP